MGAAPSSTKDKTIPVYPAKQWVENSNSFIYAYKTQLDGNYLYNPECARCNTTGCDAGDCSSATAWDKCNENGAAKLTDAMGTVYQPEGQDHTQLFKSCAWTCPDKPMCTRVNIDECLLGSNKDGYDPTLRADWSGDNSIKCTYDLKKIDNYSQIVKYMDKFRPNADDTNFFNIMRPFCSRLTNDCLIDPTTGKKIEQCSLITCTNNSDEANLCRHWFENLNNGNRNAIIANICTQNLSLAECKCENRGTDPNYAQVAKLLNGVADACAYVPCKRTSPAFLVNSTDRDAKCESNICQIIYNTNSDNKVDIYNNQNNLACNFPPQNAQVPNPDEITPHQPVDWTPQIPQLPSSLPVWQNKNIIIIGMIVIIIIIIIVIVFLKINHTKK